MDKKPIPWYHAFQRLLLLYYLLDRSKGAAIKSSCGILRDEGCHDLGNLGALAFRSPGNATKRRKAIQLEVLQL
jgi:hypothetical protein